jgi:hypothetical protein
MGMMITPKKHAKQKMTAHHAEQSVSAIFVQTWRMSSLKNDQRSPCLRAGASTIDLIFLKSLQQQICPLENV